MITKNGLLKMTFSGIAGWVVLVALVAAYVFASPHEPPELGYAGFFIVWASVLSVFYVADFALITVILYSAFRFRFLSVGVWLRSIIGASLFALTVPLWSLVGGRLHASEIILQAAIASVVGFVSFFVLSRYEERSAT